MVAVGALSGLEWFVAIENSALKSYLSDARLINNNRLSWIFCCNIFSSEHLQWQEPVERSLCNKGSGKV